MGKKRRILTRTTKFAKKYFEFLDKADGTDDDQIDTSSGRGDAFIDTISALDNEDQTVTVSGRVLGMKSGEKVEVSVDGGAFANETAIDVSGTGIDGAKYSVTIGSGAPLSKGSHSFSVRKKNATNEDLRKSATVDVRENKIGFTLSNTAVINDEAGNINIDLRTATVTTTGKAAAGVAGAASFQDGSNGFVVTVKDSGGNTVAVKAVATRTKAQAQAATGQVSAIMNVAANGVFTVTVTPRTGAAGEASLADSAQSFDVTVTGA